MAKATETRQPAAQSGSTQGTTNASPARSTEPGTYTKPAAPAPQSGSTQGTTNASQARFTEPGTYTKPATPAPSAESLKDVTYIPPSNEGKLYIEQKHAQNLSPELKKLYLEEKLIHKGLTVEESKELEELNTPKVNDDAEGESREDPNDLTKKDKKKPEAFSEMDVIKYMYENWLIKGTEYLAAEAERGLGTLYDRAERQILKNSRNEELKDQKFQKSGTKKSQDAIKEITVSRVNEIKKKNTEQIKNITEISSLITKGELFTDENKDKLDEFGSLVDKMEGVDGDKFYESVLIYSSIQKKLEKEKEEQIKTKEEYEKKLEKEGENCLDKEGKPIKEKLEKLKEDMEKNKETAYDCQKVLGEKMVEFASYHTAAVTYDTQKDLAAAQMAEARMYEDIGNDKNGLNGQDLKRKYENKEKECKADVNKLDPNERSEYIVHCMKQHDKNVKRAEYHYETSNAVTHTFTPMHIKRHKEKLGNLLELSNEAVIEASSNLRKGYAKEFDSKPKKSRNLEAIDNSLKGNNNHNNNENPVEIATDNKKQETPEKKEGLWEAVNNSNQNISDLGEALEYTKTHDASLIEELNSKLNSPEREKTGNRIQHLKAKLGLNKNQKNCNDNSDRNQDYGSQDNKNAPPKSRKDSGGR